MTLVTVDRDCNNWPEMECKIMQDCLHKIPADEQTRMQSMLEARKAMIAAGLQKQDSNLRLILARTDLFLRHRWDYDENMWAIERANPFQQWWQLICLWPADRVEELPAALSEGDLQHYNSPQEYLKYKRDKAQKIRDENEKAAEQRLLNTIENLSDTSIRQFIDAERAMRSGERIKSYGGDADTLNAMYDASKRTPPMVEDASACINPGDNPAIRVKRG